MRSYRRLDTATLALLLAIGAPSVMAAGLSLPGLFPAANVGAMFEIERKAPAGPGGATVEAAHPTAVRGADAAAGAAPAATEEAIARPRPKPAAERAPRWKSLIPGALK